MPTDPARVQAAFLAAAELADPDARAACLDHECAGDAILRARVEALLKAHDQPDSLLDAAADADTRTLPPAAPWGQTSGLSTKAPGEDRMDRPEVSPHEGTFLAPPTRPDAIGRLAHYEILAVLGRGGFGTVYRAFDEKLHRVVAVKVLAPQLAASGSARARFLREARSAAAVRDDHVVHIYEVGEQPLPYLVMEYVGGPTLQEKLDKTGPLAVPEILRIGSQVARGLAAAHATGLIHRDIKPANILLENGVERVKITDFGLARAADDASISQSGAVAGTPMYMSPEQARGEAIDSRSDLFSLGSVLYALCTGRPPFRAESTLAVLKRVVEDRPRPVREVNPDVPDWLEAIVGKLHAKDPADRFASAKEVADLLQQHLAHLQQPVTVPMPALVPMPVDAPEDWRQILEGKDYRGRLKQFGVVLVMFLPVYAFVVAAAFGWIDTLRERFRMEPILLAWLLVHLVWCAASLVVLARLKHRWQVPYKGRTLRMELSCYGSERLRLDGLVLAKCGWGLAFHELRATIPDGPGAGDRVRVLGGFGFLTPTCRILVAEGSPAQPAGTWGRARRWTRSLLWVAAIVVPIAFVFWQLIPQGWVSVKTDDPEMVVMLDGEFMIGGDNVRPDVLYHVRGKSLRTGEHTIQAVKGGQTVFRETFRLGFKERKEFDLTRKALAIDDLPDPGTPIAFKERINQTFAFRVTGQTGGGVWGTDVYTADSALAAAAIHAGVLKPGQTGVVRIKILPGQDRYEGTERNGVHSSSFAAFPASFRIVDVLRISDIPGSVHPAEGPAVPATVGGEYPDPGVPFAFRDRMNQTIAFRVTGQNVGAVWGTDVYTLDSTLAAAAVHAGVLKPGQTGVVRIKILPGRDRYEGTERNGVRSYGYVAFPTSFMIVGVSDPTAAADTAEPVAKSLREIAIAMHQYVDAYDVLPTPASVTPQGFPLLSWRVHLLPYLGFDDLYKQFKLGQPWDSEHNKKLIDKIPPVYALGTTDGKTSLVLPVGGDTMFPGGKGTRLNDLANGASNTVMVVQCDGAHRVVWTKPDDWPYNPYQPTQGLPDMFWVARADGQVLRVNTTLEPDVLKSILLRNPVKPVPPDVWINPSAGTKK